MPTTSSDEECTCERRDAGDRANRTTPKLIRVRNKSRFRRKRRRRSSGERDKDDLCKFLRRIKSKRRRKIRGERVVTSFYDPVERKTFYESLSNQFFPRDGSPQQQATASTALTRTPPPWTTTTTDEDLDDKIDVASCWVRKLPDEILLLIFGYLPLAMLLLVIPHVCRKWEKLAMDWTLWKAVEHLRINSMVVTTTEVKTLLRTIPKLKKLELVLRNDTDELLNELFLASESLEILKLDRCIPSLLHINIPPETIKSVLDLCPKLKSVTLTDTYFRCKDFYKTLADKFKTFERVNISCTTKSEMDFFVENLRDRVSGVEFQSVSMMGKADGKQIYWGPILGLVIRPTPSSPYHRRDHATNEFPNYAF